MHAYVRSGIAQIARYSLRSLFLVVLIFLLGLPQWVEANNISPQEADLMRKFGATVVQNAPANIRNGSPLDKANYAFTQMCQVLAARKVAVNNTYTTRFQNLVRNGSASQWTCGYLTEATKNLFLGAGVPTKDVFEIVADKDSLASTVFDPNSNHGAPAIMVDNQVYVFDAWQHAVNNEKAKGFFTNIEGSKWKAMKGEDWQQEMSKQGYMRYTTDEGEHYFALVAEATATFKLTEIELYNSWNTAGVSNGPSKASTFVVPATAKKGVKLIYIDTYHWNSAKGKPAGTISLKAASGKSYGPWKVIALAGQGGAPNVWWIARPGTILPAGSYTIVDSDPSTWSCDAESNYCGFSRAVGLIVR